MKERQPQRVWDFFSYFQEELINAGYPKEYIDNSFETIRRNSEKYQQLPEGDAWYKRALLNQVFVPLLQANDEERQDIMGRMFYENGGGNSPEES